MIPTHALSVRQPWASAIVFGEKRIENRTWRPTAQLQSGPFAMWIHASGFDNPVPTFHDGIATFAGSPAFVAAVRQGRHAAEPVNRMWANLPTRCIIGAAIVERVVEAPPPGQLVWWAGPLAWVLREVVPLAEPVRCPPVALAASRGGPGRVRGADPGRVGGR